MRRHLVTFGIMAVVTALSAGAFMAPAMSEPPEPGWQVVRSMAPGPTTPDAPTLLVLVRTTMMTLNDAIRTGNFTVLRDSAAPSFRDSNSAARLSVIFAKVMDSKVDLSPIALLTPQLTGSPVIDAKGMLQIRGYYALPAARVDFGVVYEPTPRGWRLYGVFVNPVPAVQSAPAQAAIQPASKGFATHVHKED